MHFLTQNALFHGEGDGVSDPESLPPILWSFRGGMPGSPGDLTMDINGGSNALHRGIALGVRWNLP